MALNYSHCRYCLITILMGRTACTHRKSLRLIKLKFLIELIFISLLFVCQKYWNTRNKLLKCFVYKTSFNILITSIKFSISFLKNHRPHLNSAWCFNKWKFIINSQKFIINDDYRLLAIEIEFQTKCSTHFPFFFVVYKYKSLLRVFRS